MTITSKPNVSLKAMSVEQTNALQHNQKCETGKAVSTEDEWLIGDKHDEVSDHDASSNDDGDADDNHDEEADGASDDDEESDDDDDEDDAPAPSKATANLVRIVGPTNLKSGQSPPTGAEGVFLSPAMAMFLRRNAGSDSALCRFLAMDDDKEKERVMRRNSASGGANAGIMSVVQTALPTQSIRYAGMGSDPAQPLVSPFQVLKDLLTEKGYSNQVRSPGEVEDNFVRGDVASHTAELMGAVRRNDLARIRQLHQQGHNLQCCNQFGESIVHTAARRGLFDILVFLKNEAGVSIRVRCDTGRNPMHDACWTGSPNFDIVELLMRDYPDFFVMSDNRGYTPLEYVPKDVWAAWNEFLQDRADLLHE